MKAILHIEDSNNKGGTYIEGEYEDILIAVVGAMQAAPAIRYLLQNALTVLSIGELKDLPSMAENVKIKVDQAAKEEYEKLSNRNEK